jgi:hypothetical protein
MALTIVQRDQATAGQKAGPGAYIGTEFGFHALAVLGSAACLSNVAVCVAGAKTALGIGGAAAEAACADGDCTNEVQTAANTGKVLLDVASKPEAREALKAGINGLSNGQTQKALEILGKGRLDQITITTLENNEIQIVAQRAGAEGFQRMIYTLDPSGKTITLIQEAYNAAGELVHVHDKLKDAIIK